MSVLAQATFILVPLLVPQHRATWLHHLQAASITFQAVSLSVLTRSSGSHFIL